MLKGQLDFVHFVFFFCEVLQMWGRFGVCVLLCFFVACSSTTSRLQQGDRAPSVRVTTLDGDLESLSDYYDKPTIVAFWATWCAKSKRALVELNKEVLQSRQSGQPLNFVTISVDKAQDLAKVTDFLTSTHLASSNKFSGNEFLDEAYIAFDVGSLPTIFQITPPGIIGSQKSNVD